MLTIVNKPTPLAGDNDTICESGTYQLAGDVICSEDFYWSSPGDGFFNDSSFLNAVYTSGELDIENGMVVLSLNAFGTNDSTDTMILYIQNFLWLRLEVLQRRYVLVKITQPMMLKFTLMSHCCGHHMAMVCLMIQPKLVQPIHLGYK
ncbi:MAG: hypothetical protein R2764_17135 [Bacteroidales bacterium]